MTKIVIPGDVTLPVAGVGDVKFGKMRTGETYFHPKATHHREISFMIGDREYWGEVVRTRTPAGCVVNVDLHTRNTRTRHGVRVRESAMAGVRAAIIAAFRSQVEEMAATVARPVTMEEAIASTIPGHPVANSQTVTLIDPVGEMRGTGLTVEVPATEYIDLTPTWSGILPTLLHIMTDATHEGRAAIRPEFVRMAALADKYVAACTMYPVAYKLAGEACKGKVQALTMETALQALKRKFPTAHAVTVHNPDHYGPCDDLPLVTVA